MILSPFIKIAKIVLLCWTKWSPELKIEKPLNDIAVASGFQNNFIEMFLLCPIAKMVLLCWTKWLQELKVEYNLKRTSPPRPVAWFLNNSDMFHLCLFTKTAKMVPLGWTKWPPETSSVGSFFLLVLHRVFVPCLPITQASFPAGASHVLLFPASVSYFKVLP